MDEARADMVWGVIFALLGIFVVVYSAPYGAIPSFDPIGAAYVPRLLGIALTILGLGMLVESYTKHKKQAATEEPGAGESSSTIDPKHLLRILYTVLCCIGYVVLLDLVGYPLLTPLFIAGIMLIYGDRNKKRIIAMALGSTVTLYVLFTIGLRVLLPAGILSPLLLR